VGPFFRLFVDLSATGVDLWALSQDGIPSPVRVTKFNEVGVVSRAADRARDTLGRVYEYFLARFASAEGKSGGQCYTPSHVVEIPSWATLYGEGLETLPLHTGGRPIRICAS